MPDAKGIVAEDVISEAIEAHPISIPDGWEQYANCRGLATPQNNRFFVERGDSIREAKAVCAGCVVKLPCLMTGLKQKHGVWGGLTSKQRRKVTSGIKRKDPDGAAILFEQIPSAGPSSDDHWQA